jgi:hypothetical protein
MAGCCIKEINGSGIPATDHLSTLRVRHECTAFLTHGPPIRDAQDAVKYVVILDQKRRERRGSGPGWIRVVVRSKNGRTPIERHHWSVTTKLTDKSHAHDDILSDLWVNAMTTPSPEGVERFQSKRQKGHPQDRLRSPRSHQVYKWEHLHS